MDLHLMIESVESFRRYGIPLYSGVLAILVRGSDGGDGRLSQCMDFEARYGEPLRNMLGFTLDAVEVKSDGRGGWEEVVVVEGSEEAPDEKTYITPCLVWSEEWRFIRSNLVSAYSPTWIETVDC